MEQADTPVSVAQDYHEPPIEATPPPPTTSNSVPTLRFPRPAGNRRLTNWVSTSSPDIMSSNDHFHEEDQTASDLGYEVIQTYHDGQADSVVDLNDYVKPDDLSTLGDDETSTDANTTDLDGRSDLSDDDHIPTVETASEPNNIRQRRAGQPRIEYMELPETFPMHLNEQQSHEAFADHSSSSDSDDDNLATDVESDNEQPIQKLKHKETPAKTRTSLLSPYLDLFEEIFSRPLASPFHFIAGGVALFAILLGMSLGATGVYKSFMYPDEVGPIVAFRHDKMQVGSTLVPASVKFPASTSGLTVSTATVSVTVSLTTTTTVNALQTTASSNNLASIVGNFWHDKAPSTHLETASKPPVCSAKTYGPHGILVQAGTKALQAWKTHDAMNIAVYRGAQPVSSELTVVDEGFLVNIHSDDAYGNLQLALKATRGLKVDEVLEVNFGRHLLNDAYGVGKQLARGFAQKLAGTVNDTTLWVDKACVPAIDSVSRQLSHQTLSVTESLVKGLGDMTGAARNIRSHIIEKIKNPINTTGVAEQLDQVHKDITRNFQDTLDGLAINILVAQLNAKAWWLRAQGKEQESEQYLSFAETYYKKKLSEVASAKRERHARGQPDTQKAKRSVWLSFMGV